MSVLSLEPMKQAAGYKDLVKKLLCLLLDLTSFKLLPDIDILYTNTILKLCFKHHFFVTLRGKLHYACCHVFSG